MSDYNQEFVRFSMIFRQVCRTPDQFTVCGSLREVLAFLAGLYIGAYRVPREEESDNNDELNEPKEVDPMEGFNRWLAQKDGCKQSADWARTAYMVLKIYDNKEAFEKLHQLFNQYISQQLGITAESYQSKLF